MQTGWSYSFFVAKVLFMSGTQLSNDLEQGLKPRHVTMLSIAGVIGAGLFVGSGHRPVSYTHLTLPTKA